MEVSGQLHALVNLPLGNMPPLYAEQEAVEICILINI